MCIRDRSEVIQRHYGDCKDKANLLVAMLRAAGIPANLALLSTGPGRDVDPQLPGINQFDHAIVYVPAATTAAHDDPLAGGHGAVSAQGGALDDQRRHHRGAR